MCPKHLQATPRATLCGLRLAWHDGDTDRIREWAQRAVDDVQQKILARELLADARARRDATGRWG